MLKKFIAFFKRLFGFGNGGQVNYIGNGEALPPPLDAEQELVAIEKMMAGDIEARNKLIEHNLRLVVYIAKRFENTGLDIEDLVSVGTIGLIKAINSYDNTKKIKLATYSARCIENEILMFLRKNNKVKNTISLDEPLNVDWEGNMLLLSDILGTDPEDVFYDAEKSVEREALKKCANKLPEREREIIKMRFGILGIEKKTQKEIADIMGISQSYISRLEKKVLDKLKKEISKMV